MVTGTQVVRVARSQVGYVEGGGADGHSGNQTKYGAAFGWNGVAWCSIFVWWVHYQLGIDLKKVGTSLFASCVYAVNAWRAKGCFTFGVKGAQPGVILYFNWPGGEAEDHTGILDHIDRNGIHTVEGNTSSGNSGSQTNGGGTYARLRDASLIVGYAKVPGVRYTVVARVVHAVKRVVAKKYPTLVLHSHGANVTRLQRLLTARGYNVGPSGADGFFGAATEAAVRAFQRHRGLWVDGQAGPRTLAALGF